MHPQQQRVESTFRTSSYAISEIIKLLRVNFKEYETRQNLLFTNEFKRNGKMIGIVLVTTIKLLAYN